MDQKVFNAEEINSIIKDAKSCNQDIGKVTDGCHTFDELYWHRLIMFSVILKDYKIDSFKSKLHDDGTMFDDYFICGILTKEGWFTYHYHIDHWDMFDVKIMETAPKWDGHTASDITRLLKLIPGTTRSA